MKDHQKHYGRMMGMLLKKIYKSGPKDMVAQSDDEEEEEEEDEEMGSPPERISGLSEKNVKKDEQFPKSARKKEDGMMIIAMGARKGKRRR